MVERVSMLVVFPEKELCVESWCGLKGTNHLFRSLSSTGFKSRSFSTFLAWILTNNAQE
jgi:hypothetical protein